MLARKVKLKLNKKQRKDVSDLSLKSAKLYNILLQHNTDLLNSGSNEYYTSQTCYKCKRIQKMELWEREYICNCGYSNDRDVNSALNILSIGEKLRL